MPTISATCEKLEEYGSFLEQKHFWVMVQCAGELLVGPMQVYLKCSGCYIKVLGP